MPIHCKIGDKPIVKYKFSGDTKNRIYKTRFAPIDVSIKTSPILNGENYNREGYQLTYTSQADPNGFSGTAILIVRDHITFSWNGGTWITQWRCGNNDWDSSNNEFAPFTLLPRNKDGKCKLVRRINPASIIINTAIKCPTANNERCSIVVMYNGQILHQDQGNCPVNYSVQCGKCPDGQHECESKIYPYYCCNSCADTAKKINNIANKMRS